MSDGPHKTLPLRRHWKDLAERAAKAAFSSDEVCEALPLALKRDFFAEAPVDAVQEIFGGGKQGILFTDNCVEQLEAVRQSCRSAVGSILIDCAIAAAKEGCTGNAAFQAALQGALDEHARGVFRSMEEHYQREGSARSAKFLRDRLDAARNQSDFAALAADVAKEGKQSAASLQLAKHTGLDEGPSL